MNEQALVQQLRSGDPSAFRLLYERYAPRLAAFATRFKAGREEADEIVQETFIRIWKHRDRIDANSPFEAYLYASLLEKKGDRALAASVRKDLDKEKVEAAKRSTGFIPMKLIAK